MEKALSIYGKRNDFANELKRIERAPISERNKELIKDFQSNLLANNIKENRVVKLSHELRKIAGWLDKDFDKAIREDLEKVVVKINLLDWASESTKCDYKRAIRQFYKFLKGNGEVVPPEAKWIKTRVPLQQSRYVGQLITPEEVEAMISIADNAKDRALTALLYESGARVAEVLTMKISDFMPGENFTKVRLYGKTGERFIPIVTSVPYICQYLSMHPFRQDKSSRLWLNFSTYKKNEPLAYIGVNHMLRRLAKKAGISKNVNPHRFRHARATELANSLTETQLCLYFGWVLGSEQVRTYVHASGRDLDNAVMKLHSMQSQEQKTEEQIQKPITCARCKTINGSADRFCSNCGAALTIKIALEAEEKIKEETNKTVELLMEVMKNPELLKRFEEFKKTAS